MANPWFRLYAEFANDAKVQMLSESNQRRLVMLLCIRCNGDVTLHDDEVAFQLRISNEDWLATKDIFVGKKFINQDNEILNWNKRQFISDSSAGRVAKHRQKKKQVGNVTVTAPDTEQNQKQSKPKTLVRSSSARFDEFWELWPRSPRKVGKAACLKKWIAKNLDGISDQIIQHVTEIKKTKQWADGFEPAPITYINQGRWGDEIFIGTGFSPSNTKPWYISGTGIEAKAKELGIEMIKDETFHDFKVRVYLAAEITPEMIRVANRDFGGKK